MRALLLSFVLLGSTAFGADVPLFNGDFEQPGLTAELVPVGWHTDLPGLKPSLHAQFTRLRTIPTDNASNA